MFRALARALSTERHLYKTVWNILFEVLTVISSEYTMIALQGTIAKGKLSDFKQRVRTSSVWNDIFKKEPRKFKVASELHPQSFYKVL